MALSGVNITFSPCNIILNPSLTLAQSVLSNVSANQALLSGVPSASQTMATAGTSTISAMTLLTEASVGLLSISASAPIFYATGPNPDATNGPRRYMDPAFGREDIFVNPGDKFAWVFA
jgi:hypothetical protein